MEDTLKELVDAIPGSLIKNDEMLLGLCKEMVTAISDLTRIITVQGKTITMLTETVATHNRILSIHNVINKVQ